jgi:hypothetical protein
MSKATQTPQESGLLGQTAPEAERRKEPPAAGAAVKPEPEAGKPKESKVHRLSQGDQLYTPKKRERKTPALLTADQYLRKAKQDGAISGLIRSLHKTKLMIFAEWERETAALLRKKTW